MDASDDELVKLRSSRILFLACDIDMAASVSGRTRKEKEAIQVDHARAVPECGLHKMMNIAGTTL